MSSSPNTSQSRTRRRSTNNATVSLGSQSNNSLSNESDTNRSNREFVLPTSMVRLLRTYMRPSQAVPRILREADFDYEHYIRWAKRDAAPMVLLADSVLATQAMLAFWLSVRDEITTALRFVSNSASVLANEFRLIEEVMHRFSRPRLGRRVAFQNGAALIVFAKHVVSEMSFIVNIKSILPKLKRSNHFREFVHVHHQFKDDLILLDDARKDAQIPLPIPGPANAAHRYKERPPLRRHAWLNKITNLPLSKGERSKAQNLRTLEPLEKGVPLACGHVITKDTLVALTDRVGKKRACPRCQKPITRKHLLRVAAMDPKERVRALEQQEREKASANTTNKRTK